MAWKTSFLLGRPTMELTFEVNPEAISFDWGPLASLQRNLAGDLKKSILRPSLPIVTIQSSFLSLTQRNQFATLAEVDDTFLSFQTRDDWQVVLTRAVSSSTTQVALPRTSATKLDQLLASLFGNPIITSVTGVFVNADGSGTNYYSGGGSLNHSTSVITLGSALPATNTVVYITYTYTGWLVNLPSMRHSYQGGWIDRAQYDFELTGA